MFPIRPSPPFMNAPGMSGAIVQALVHGCSPRRIDTLQEYVLLDPDTRSSEVFSRNERGLFELHDQTGGPELHLASVGLRLAMVDVFDGVEGGAEAKS